MSRAVGAETSSCCLARPLANRMFENDSVSTSVEESIVSTRLDDENQYDGIAIYRLSSKILPLRVDDFARRIGGESCENREQTMSSTQPRRESPLVAKISITNTKLVPGFLVSPERKFLSDELLSVERLDRLLKMRRRRNRLRKYNHPGHSWSSGFEKEKRLPRNIYLPEIKSDLLCDADPAAPSKFVLKPRVEHKIILSHRRIQQKNDFSR